MRNLLILMFLSCFAFSSNLELVQGEIKAHTEVFGDSEINPSTKKIDTNLSINSIDFKSIRGKVLINSGDLKSSKEARDENMYELLNTKVYPSVVFDIKDIKKEDKNYIISGLLTLNGVTKELSSQATIIKIDENIQLMGDFNILLSQFNMEAPTMFFLTVRDQIDINYTLVLK
ncbi:MAG: YceI family protein [Poseidonibacter sp.]|uniref:YceI family protein n=1 Tax=Poseidonibacter sp. TaxID=2321188 RepID=UPI00359CDD32